MYLTPEKINYGRRAFVRSVAMDLVLTIFTCGLWNFVVQNRQIEATNYLLGLAKYSFWRWLILTFVTCGLYHIYHEYIMSQDLQRVSQTPSELHAPLVHLIICLFGFSVITDALQQSMINQMLGEKDANGTTILPP